MQDQNQRLEDLPDTLTVEETAGVLRISRNSAYEAIRRREIPALKLGRRVVVPKRALMAMLMPASA